VQELGNTLLDQALAYTVLEAVAVILAVMYLVLAIRQSIWCWLCAGISTIIFAYLFFDVRLYMEALLNLFYLAMAVYGWRSWRSGRGAGQELPVVVWSHKLHLSAISAVVAISLVSGYLLDTRSDAAFPYVDSLTTWSAVWATFLVARKVLENWWYWLVIDATMIYVFWAKDLELTAVLYIMYLVLIPVGLLTWTRSYRELST
jgi:nicotinamide mononucleotide transporter